MRAKEEVEPGQDLPKEVYYPQCAKKDCIYAVPTCVTLLLNLTLTVIAAPAAGSPRLIQRASERKVEQTVKGIMGKRERGMKVVDEKDNASGGFWRTRW